MIQLSDSWENCPTCWQNFVDDLYQNHGCNDYNIDETIISELLKYGALVEGYEEMVSNELFFETELQETYFILRWS